ncbi:MAG: radical SAM protein [Thermodesulfobacteriota bacterium]
MQNSGNKCNSQCIMCSSVVHMGTDVMSFELFKKVCDEARIMEIEKMVITGGEPLLDRGLIEKIRYAKSIGFTYIHMFTNGSLLNEVNSSDIIDSGLDSLTISVDSAIKEEYEAIRVGLKYDNLIQNIRRFCNIRKEKQSNKPLLRINMVALAQNKNSRALFIKTFAPYADIVEIVQSHNFASIFSGSSYYESIDEHPRHRYPCNLMFSKLVVDADGTVRKCSIDYDKRASLGNVTDQSLYEIWSSERFNNLRKRMLDYDFSEPGCNACTHCQSWWIDAYAK